jgi:hypothetical protein
MIEAILGISPIDSPEFVLEMFGRRIFTDLLMVRIVKEFVDGHLFVLKFCNMGIGRWINAIKSVESLIQPSDARHSVSVCFSDKFICRCQEVLRMAHAKPW